VIDPVAPVVLGVALILAVAKVGGEIAVRLGQPSVLGELVFGVIIGNLSLLGADTFSFLERIDMISSSTCSPGSACWC